MNDTDAQFEVVTNDQGQYSLWPVGKPMPIGWTAAGWRGERQGCLDYIAEHWTDMRPRSLRGEMGAHERVRDSGGLASGDRG
ncbi:MbtH family NRPS accessory protein [Pseudomonas sp. SZMC_28357]|uniref:MbtH family protein n=1 Tax=Pseudomonas sp. SZMC_28357 TaxID=3074380 RepID=UPI0028720FEB|nr:MbtH family NRPS accessory protein [Pseudomonas sp. SZMC_28357]MDR9750408.1 MbtH family NRPS accessory protein [Pseudomonas sp. SZMC_28357]